MNNRKNALLLSGFLLICVWLILFLVAVTEEGATAYNFGIASTIAGACGAACMILWIVLDVVEERKDASGIYNFEYYRLKRKKEGKQMKEYTLTYTVEITEVVNRGGKLPVELDETYTDKRTIEQHIKDGTLRPDDVHVKGGVKIFEREL